MQKLKRNFLYPEGVIASYNYTDIAEGTGVSVFNCLQAGNATSYALSTNTINSSHIAPNASGILLSNDYVYFTLTTFNTPKTIKGTAYVTGELAANANSVTISATLQKNNVDISSEVTTSALIQKQGLHMAIPVTQTNFKAGDILRLKFKTAGTGSGQGVLVDPTHIFQSGNTLKLLVPFRIDT